MSKFVIFSIKLCNRSGKHHTEPAAADVGFTRVAVEAEHARINPIAEVAPATEPGVRGRNKARVITIPACSFA